MAFFGHHAHSLVDLGSDTYLILHIICMSSSPLVLSCLFFLLRFSSFDKVWVTSRMPTAFSTRFFLSFSGLLNFLWPTWYWNGDHEPINNPFSLTASFLLSLSATKRPNQLKTCFVTVTAHCLTASEDEFSMLKYDNFELDEKLRCGRHLELRWRTVLAG